MKATINFKITEFHSLGSKEVNFKHQETCEDTFRSIWKSLNKTLDKNWQSIEFEFNNETILVCRHWLKETNFNFQESHQII
jgi:hypothetical protein